MHLSGVIYLIYFSTNQNLFIFEFDSSQSQLRSVCNFSVSSSDLITCKHFVSSANIKGMKNWIHSGRSLIKVTNSRGPTIQYFINFSSNYCH